MEGIGVEDRTALVTGSSRGIGRGVAPGLAECGVGRIGVHHLRDREAAEETARLPRGRGAGRVPVWADVTRAGDTARMPADDRPTEAALRPVLAVADAAFVADGIALGLPLA